MMKKVLVGYISSGKTSGIDKYLLNFLEKVFNDDISFDFLTKNYDEELGEYLKKYSAKLISIPRNRKPISQLFFLIKMIKENKYDTVYVNISESYNFLCVIAAKICGIKNIVTHSHSSGSDNNSVFKRKIMGLLNFICKPIISFCANKYLACSKKAAEWLYCKGIIDSENYKVIYNAIDYEKFKYDEKIRISLRKKYKINDKFVIGHLGNFCYQKNHKFLLDTFKLIIKQNPNAVLVCIGKGNDFDQIVEYSKNIDVYDKVIFTGPVDNVNEFMQAFDIFLLPSNFEGLPIVGVEAQFASLPCIFSSKITNEVIISDNSIMLDIQDPQLWADNVLKTNITKREKNHLTDEAENYFLDKQRKQFDYIINSPVPKKDNSFFSVGFKLLFFIHLLLNTTIFYNGIHTFLFPIAIALSGYFLMNISRLKDLYRDNYMRLFSIFLLSYLFTFLLCKNYNMVSNIKILIWMIIEFFFVFNNNSKSKYKVISEIYIIFFVIVAATFLTNIGNLYLLLIDKSSFFTAISSNIYIYGLSSWGRFYGLFCDPNYASILCGCSIFISLFLISISKGRIIKIFYILNIILNYIYVVFSQSRTWTVSFFVAMLTYFLLYNINKNKKINYMKLCISGLIALFITVVLPKIIIHGYNYVKSEPVSPNVIIQDDFNRNDITTKKILPVITTTTSIKEVITEKKLVIKREETLNKDISNRRFAIWKSGFELSKDNLLYGVGFANIQPYAEENNPETYIISNDFSKFNAFHNTVIDVLASQGLIGILIMFSIIIYTILKIIRNRKIILQDNIDTKILIYSFSILILIGSSSMFLSHVFYVNVITTYLFWLCFGYFIYFININNISKKEVKK